MKRKDGLTKVINMFIGNVVFKKKEKDCDYVVIKGINYEVNDEEFNEVELNWKGQCHYTKMIKKICEYTRRSEFIVKIVKDLIKKDKNDNLQIMILAHNKSLIKYLFESISVKNLCKVGYYVGGIDGIDFKISDNKKVIIARYALAE